MLRRPRFGKRRSKLGEGFQREKYERGRTKACDSGISSSCDGAVLCKDCRARRVGEQHSVTLVSQLGAFTSD
jgi:hypothetical protein